MIDTTSASTTLLTVLLQDGASGDGLTVPWASVLLAASVVGYALVNTIEIAVVGASRIRIRHLAEGGSRSAQALERIRKREDRFFSSIVLFQNLFVFVASSMAGLIAVDLAGGLGLLFATIIGTAVIALFGEVTPKVLAARMAEPVALIVARPTELLTIAVRPVAAAFSAAPNLIARAFFGGQARVTPTVTEAELRMLIDIGAEEGAVAEEEAELMDRVFRFHDRRVNEILVPRTEVDWLESGTTIADFYKAFSESPHSRFPVYRESIDSVVGVVNIKDVLRAIADGRATPGSPVDVLMRPAQFVPETKLISALFLEMQESRQHMAVVVDEFGGTAGIVTLEMLLEEMVGDLVDELGQIEEEFEQIDERTVRIDGGMSVQEVREDLQIPLPDGDYETVAGYVLSVLGHIPQPGESFTGDGYAVTVTEVTGRKIDEVEVVLHPGARRPTKDEAS